MKHFLTEDEQISFDYEILNELILLNNFVDENIFKKTIELLNLPSNIIPYDLLKWCLDNASYVSYVNEQRTPLIK